MTLQAIKIFYNINLDTMQIKVVALVRSKRNH